MAEKLLTVEQAATRLHVHPITVRRHLRNGMLRGIKRGKLWRVPESALLENTPTSMAAAASTQGSSSVSPEVSSSVSPLAVAVALALVEERDVRVGHVTLRERGVNDAATELRQIREAQTP